MLQESQELHFWLRRSQLLRTETVSGLDGDRIGISLFNTSSVQYVPMTDDYDFVLRRLEELETYLG